MQNADLEQAVEISNDIYWVGSGSKSFLSRNSYLRIFKGSGNVANMLIDPGPSSDLNDLITKTTQVLGDISKINMLFINHQDPDVVGNLPYLCKINPRNVVLATEDTWRLVSLNSPQVTFKAVERFKNFRVSLNTQPSHRLQFIPTPFCHFRGACMLYDLESRILFTGDFMGGIAALGLMATEDNWPGIKAFHQLYMPSNEAIRKAVQKIRELTPAPLMLAPQHGGIIQGELIPEFLSRMEELQVGLDIISSLEDKFPMLISAANEIVVVFKELCDEETSRQVLGYFDPDGSYPALVAMSQDGTVTDIKGEPVEVIEALIKVFLRNVPADRQNILKARMTRILLEHNLPPFDLLLAQQEASADFLLDEN
ncbi:MBL fold metallo-hydrolase [Trichlorobacter ammonificans]|uniref:Beta-lactamase domain protein n=1 Tax=Trichlorobacter ammonificans TaxID=2916410 RepID=A0ABM9D9D1_9BACT|nr:MBL fold metallo-hydrolase [Trichlorobacter ammonificans]CAH2030989.1 Beta-lactamase domain protein [Trichlorobacter ammonificans]